ncbi:MAG TPA: DUF5667 domain-containing protein [Nocardioides sp.]|nr:DUF5667 domain-containing protein [Nocardioides sp.]
MKRGFASRRRADEFDALLSGAAAGRASAHEYADLLTVVSTLRSAPDVPARPEYVADLRSRLMAEAETMSRPVRSLDAATVARLTPKQRRGASERRLATVLGGFAVVAATGSMAMASQGALPGDVLYPVKRAIENAHTNLQSDDAAKSNTLIAHAEQRIAEVEALSSESGDNGATIAATLQDFTEQTGQAADLAIDDYAETGDADAIEELRTFTATSMDQLTSLGDSVPADARPALITAAQTVRQADGAAFQLCPTCGDSPITELPAFASQALDPLLTAGFAPSTTAAPAEDITEILRNLEAAKDVADAQERKQQQRERERLEAGGTGTEDDLPLAEEPEAPRDPLGQIADGVKDLLNGKQVEGANSEDDQNGGAGGLQEITEGLVNGVGGLLGGLLPQP